MFQRHRQGLGPAGASGDRPEQSPILTLRVVEVRFGRKWYCYVTSVLDPVVLPPFMVADIYRRCWRLEKAFYTVKRLLNLCLPLDRFDQWHPVAAPGHLAFYLLLIDLGGAVADALSLPFERISLEMLHRGFYHFIQAYRKGRASDPVAYFAVPENRDLGIMKMVCKPNRILNTPPYPT